jgi:hypothetical protein
MGCCGQMRAQAASPVLRASEPASAPLQAGAASTAAFAGDAGRAPPTWQAATGVAGEVAVRYLGSAPVRVPGPVTGRAYVFSAASPVAVVTAQDAPALLGTPYFTRVR